MQTSNNHTNIITRTGRAFSGIDVPHRTRPVPGFNLFYSHSRPDVIKGQRNAGHIDRGNSNPTTNPGNELPILSGFLKQSSLISGRNKWGSFKAITLNQSR